MNQNTMPEFVVTNPDGTALCFTDDYQKAWDMAYTMGQGYGFTDDTYGEVTALWNKTKS